VFTILRNLGSSKHLADSFAMSNAVEREIGFIKPWGLSKYDARRPNLAQFLFISVINKQISGQPVY
jgi:hypothetical protein